MIAAAATACRSCTPCSSLPCAAAQQVADINKPPQRDEDDTIATRMEEWSGLPYPSDLLSEYRVASASPSCLCLRRKGQQDVSVVMLEFRRERGAGTGQRAGPGRCCACVLPDAWKDLPRAALPGRP